MIEDDSDDSEDEHSSRENADDEESSSDKNCKKTKKKAINRRLDWERRRKNRQQKRKKVGLQASSGVSPPGKISKKSSTPISGQPKNQKSDITPTSNLPNPLTHQNINPIHNISSNVNIQDQNTNTTGSAERSGQTGQNSNDALNLSHSAQDLLNLSQPGTPTLHNFSGIHTSGLGAGLGFGDNKNLTFNNLGMVNSPLYAQGLAHLLSPNYHSSGLGSTSRTASGNNSVNPTSNSSGTLSSVLSPLLDSLLNSPQAIACAAQSPEMALKLTVCQQLMKFDEFNSKRVAPNRVVPLRV